MIQGTRIPETEASKWGPRRLGSFQRGSPQCTTEQVGILPVLLQG